MQLKNKVAFITGAGAGIGQAISLLFALEGAAVTLFDINQTYLDETAKIIHGFGTDFLSICGSVTSSSDISSAIQATEQAFGGLDILIANAGVAMRGSVVDMSEADWNRVLDINLGGVFRVSKYGIPCLLKRGGGSIINLASTQSFRGYPGWAGYAASKGAIVALTRQVAMEYSKQRIRCNAIAPGAVDTPMNAGVFGSAPDPAAERQKWADATPLGRLGIGEDIARAALYLASDDSSWVTGTCMVVDGGQLAG
ncbi:MAG: glucose 1-dehydrogenase [Chloroflexi bacterium]|nr:glucose 1-dehydrogenase [Chloroflexota bacterium]